MDKEELYNEISDDSIEELKTKLENLRSKKEDVEQLSDFSKRLYFSSIPVVFLFTAFIEVLMSMQSLGFDVYEYLILNGLSLPAVFLINNFVCGTSASRKKKKNNINAQIENAEILISILSEEKQKTNVIELKNNICKIKPIERKYEEAEHKAYTKKLTNLKKI